MLALSFALWLAASLCYLTRADTCAAVTFYPSWVWALLGLLLAAAGWGRPRWRPLACVLLWLFFLLAFAEEMISLTRGGPWPPPEWQAARAQGRALRVVSLNCAGGSADAAMAVARYHPDVVLLQESPTRKETEAVARRLFGREAALAWGFDDSIVARGRLRRVALPRNVDGFLTQARVSLPSGLEVEVMSTRLIPTVFRLDLWRADCWRAHRDNRRRRREQLVAITRRIQRVPRRMPLILGGDFNAPAGDAVFRLLKPRLRDTFREGGRGWGNTAIDSAPVARIDQIWVSEQLRPVSVLAREARHSDHRMVVCDLELRGR